jgi:hypothetical protein
MGKYLLIGLMIIGLVGCASVSPQVVRFDKTTHENILKVAKERIKWVSCDIGLIDGLGIAVAAEFPIWDANEARAILTNPGISLALGEIRQIAQDNTDPETQKPYWKPIEYDLCKVEGLGWRAAALGTIDILKLFPQLLPYLAIFGPTK